MVLNPSDKSGVLLFKTNSLNSAPPSPSPSPSSPEMMGWEETPPLLSVPRLDQSRLFLPVGGDISSAAEGHDHPVARGTGWEPDGNLGRPRLLRWERVNCCSSTDGTP